MAELGTAAEEKLPEPRAERPVNGADGTFKATFKGGGFRGKLELDTLVSVVVHDMKPAYSEKFDKDQILWQFRVEGQDEDDGELWLYTSVSMHKKSGLPPVLAALGIAGPTEESPSLSKEACIGKTCRALIEGKEQDDGKTVPRIAKLVANAKS